MPKSPFSGTSNVLKVNIGWAALIFGGIGAFVLAKQQVEQKRKKQMKLQRVIIENVEREATK